MNFAILERMIRERDLSKDALLYLINCRAECEWLDYKKQLNFDIEKQLCDFAKDVVAMKNSGGGYIVIGVEDKTWKPIGIESEVPCDAKMLRDKVRKATGLDLDVNIVHHILEITNSRRLFALIFIHASKKRSKRRTPSLIKYDYRPSEPYGLRRGEIYARDLDSTVKIDKQEQLEDLLDRIEAQTDESIILSNKPQSPFAVNQGLFRLLEKGYENFVGRDELKNKILQKVTEDPRIWIINVHGPGGVGKSAIVNWVTYTLFEKNEFEAILQLTAKETILTHKGIRPYSRSLYSLDDLLEHILLVFEETMPSNIEDAKEKAYEILSAWKTLLVLDNMETVSDGRILNFVQEFPRDSKAKVILTSRHKSGGWEYAIPINEFSIDETMAFIETKSREMNVSFPITRESSERVLQVSGGLPLAIQWIIGQFKIEGKIDNVLNSVYSESSPVLEFSFRNIWERLSSDGKAVLCVLSIFDSPPTLQQISIAMEWPNDKIEKALYDLTDVTLVTKTLNPSDGNVLYAALPITLKFAQHQFHTMGDFEARCRQRYQKFDEQIRLQESETFRFISTFERHGLSTDNEKKAAILCSRAQSEMFNGYTDNSDSTFKQARELAPQSAYIYAMSASYELARNRVGLALEYAKKACGLSNGKTGELCYTILARVLDVQRDKVGRVEALRKALEFNPDDMITRHQYGVALSRCWRTQDAVNEFSKMIDYESRQVPKSETYLMALKTRVINYRRLGMHSLANDDIKTAKTVLAENPHLKRHAHHIYDLDS